MGTESHERPIEILQVEDNSGDVRLTQEAFNAAGVRTDLHAVTNGGDALDYLHQQGGYADASYPDIMLIDLNIPGMNGIELLEEIKDDQDLKLIPAIVLTSSKAEEDIVKSYEAHANAYLTKPLDPDEFVDIARLLGEFWIKIAKLPPIEE